MEKKKGHPFLIFVIVLLSIILGLFLLQQCADSTSSNPDGSPGTIPQLFTRDAKNSDINIDISNDFALSMNYTMIPQVDINNLTLKFTYTDSNNKTITTVTKHIGNVVKGNQYKIQVSLTEFSLLDIFRISYGTCSVTGGTVSFFA